MAVLSLYFESSLLVFVRRLTTKVNLSQDESCLESNPHSIELEKSSPWSFELMLEQIEAIGAIGWNEHILPCE